MLPQNRKISEGHTFHIPVMGLGFSIDTPIKVARFGISSVISIMEDHLIEKMRELHCKNNGLSYSFIATSDVDYRARRITAYLNLVDQLICNQVARLKKENFEKDSEIVKYFEMMPNNSGVKSLYNQMSLEKNHIIKLQLQNVLKRMIVPGDTDVNIMTKLDKTNYSKDGLDLGPEYTDASSALRGFAKSNLQSSIVFSAGMNPRLFSYCAKFESFFPNSDGILIKKIILKVSDYRSAAIQGKFLAKKGLWVSEFRIESGLNCGGHAFATDGLLMGPILEEFKTKREELFKDLYTICATALSESNRNVFKSLPTMRITAQGGLGTAEEHDFLLAYYNLDRTGWGSPFLLVPEATNVDLETLGKLSTAKKEDYFLSNASPLGVPFNNFRYSSSEEQRLSRIAKGKAGSPCYKKFLAFDIEFGPKPICTASRQYQDLKIKQLRERINDDRVFADEANKIMEKDCLCEGLGAPALLKNNLEPSHKLKAVTICPGPNLAYFSGVYKMDEMLDHIYGRRNLLNTTQRSHMFINEMLININYLKDEYNKYTQTLNTKKLRQLQIFKDNLISGIEYYKSLLPSLKVYEGNSVKQILYKLGEAGNIIMNMNFALETEDIK